MANKRMFSKQIIDSDAFLDMPTSSQVLYFHLVMRADDEGFVGNPKKIVRMLNVGDDDFKILVAKRFIITFESGVIVIKHWLMHNAIRMDRFNPTSYEDEKKLLITKENKAYTEWQPDGNLVATQVKLSKVNLSEVKLVADATTPKEEAIKFFIMVKSNSKEFGDYLLNFNGSSEVAKREINKFTLYWTELNSTGKKQRWEQERTFEVKKRLVTWFSKVKDFKGKISNNKYQADTV